MILYLLILILSYQYFNSKTKLRNEQSQVYPMLIIDWINSIQPCEEYFDYVIKLDFIEGISTIFYHIYDNNKD